MTDPIRLWLETSHHGPFRVGGWAFLRAAGAELAGTAGGERQTDAERAALQGLLAALKGLPAGQGAVLHTSSALVAAVPARLQAGGDDAPSTNLELWAQAKTALAARPVRFVRVAQAPKTAQAFAAAWAELARDRAKDRGPFASAIPKSNLANAGVPPA